MCGPAGGDPSEKVAIGEAPAGWDGVGVSFQSINDCLDNYNLVNMHLMKHVTALVTATQGLHSFSICTDKGHCGLNMDVGMLVTPANRAGILAPQVGMGGTATAAKPSPVDGGLCSVFSCLGGAHQWGGAHPFLDKWWAPPGGVGVVPTQFSINGGHQDGRAPPERFSNRAGTTANRHGFPDAVPLPPLRGGQSIRDACGSGDARQRDGRQAHE